METATPIGVKKASASCSKEFAMVTAGNCSFLFYIIVDTSSGSEAGFWQREKAPTETLK